MFDLVQPPSDVRERLTARNVVHDNNPVRPAIIPKKIKPSTNDATATNANLRARYRPEPLLPSRIPYLQLDPLPIHLYGPNLKIDTDCRDIIPGEGVIGEPQQQRTLPHTLTCHKQTIIETFTQNKPTPHPHLPLSPIISNLNK